MEKQQEKIKEFTSRSNIQEKVSSTKFIEKQKLNNGKCDSKSKILENSSSQIKLQNIKEVQRGKNGDLFVVIQFALDQNNSREFQKTETVVDLSYTNITDSQVKVICQLLPHLRQLNLNYCQNIKSIQLKNCKELQYLSIQSANSLTDIQLKQMPVLKGLNLCNCKQLQSIELVQLTQLVVLNLTYCSKLKQAIQLKNCKNIKQLWLSGVDQSHQNLVQLLSQQSAQLVKLDLRGWKQIQFSQLKFNNCKKLSTLYLEQTEITDEDVQRLETQIPQLEYLSLQGCKKIVNPSLNNFNKLTVINLSNTSVSIEKVKELKKKHPKIFPLNSYSL